MSDAQPNVLIVEDETIVAADLSDQLKTLGFNVVAVSDRASEAVRLSELHQPDLVLMDIHLNGAEDGIEAAREIRRRWQIPIIFLTAHSNQETFLRAEAISPHAYLTKPFRIEEVQAAVALARTQQQVTRQLFEENIWLRTAVASLSDGVIATDHHGRVRFMSPIAAALTEWSIDEALGQPIDHVYQLYSTVGEPIQQRRLKRVLDRGEAVPRSEFLLRARSGRELFVEDTAAPITGTGGHLLGAITIFLDITERREAELQRDLLRRELLRSNEELSRFSYALAHDLQAPLRTVHTFAELLSNGQRGELNDDQRQLATTILQATEGMKRMVQAMLAFAQFGKGELRLDNIRVEDLVRTVVAKLATLVDESEAHIVYHHLPEIIGDAIQLEQLFQNLLSNAMKYRLPGRPAHITVAGIETRDGWTFTVADQGQGLPPEAGHQIFEPLRRLHGSEIPGTGLGLAICRKIVERHGGEINAESPGPGLGTTFRFTIGRP